MNDSLGPLTNGSTVVVIGGGPGGASCAIALKRLARAMACDLNVIIYEGKTFAGEAHYNQCIGVLSPPIENILEQQLDIPFPRHLVHRHITGYILHTDCHQVVLDGEDERSYALRRVQFDDYLLEQARQHGAQIIHSRVTDLEFHADRVVIYSESDNREAAVVVGAFGLDDGSTTAMARASTYRPPRFLESIVTKIHPPDEAMANFGNRIHAFLPRVPQIEFGAVTPKANHLAVNIAGAGVDASWMDYFLSWEPVRRVMPFIDRKHPIRLSDFHYFKGRFPISIAQGYFGDRYVLVGDAAGLVRAFKGKGINSACLTGLWAAKVIMTQGVSRAAFAEHYTRACREILTDLPYGRAVRYLVGLGGRLGLLERAITAAEGEPAIRAALFDAVSGHQPYRTIIQSILKPRLIGRTLANMIRLAIWQPAML